MEKPRMLISACLMGVACRYDGRSKALGELAHLMERYTLIPVCPEQLGGLPTPRPPAEIAAGRVRTQDGADVTVQYDRGAEEVLRLAQCFGCKKALLKERSPSCGSGEIYDGSFSRKLISGRGRTAALLEEHGVTVVGESQITDLL